MSSSHTHLILDVEQMRIMYVALTVVFTLMGCGPGIISSMALVTQNLTSFELIGEKATLRTNDDHLGHRRKMVVLASTDTSRWAKASGFDMSLSSERICIQPSMHRLKGGRW